MKTLALIALLCLAPINASIAGEQRRIAAPVLAPAATSPPSRARALQMVGEGRAPVTAPAPWRLRRGHHHHGHHWHHDYADHQPYIPDPTFEPAKPLYCVNCYNH